MIIRNSYTTQGFIHFLNERQTKDFRLTNIENRVNVVMEISKEILKEEARAIVEQSLVKVQKDVASLNEEFYRIIQGGFIYYL